MKKRKEQLDQEQQAQIDCAAVQDLKNQDL